MDLTHWSWFLFVWEIAAATQPFDPCYFWPGSMYVNGKCFLVLPDRGTFIGAKDKCIVKHGVVAEARSQDEMNTLLSLMTPPKNFVYIGLTDEITEGTHLWKSDGTPLNRSLTPWNITCKGDVNPEVADCVMLMSNGELVCRDSSWSMFIACQKAVANPCDFYLSGAEFYSGSCFLYVQDGSGIDGQVFCEEKGAFLVEPKTTELMDYIKAFSSRHTAGLDSKDFGIRIGGVALLPGDWSWIASGEAISFLPWSSDEPNQLDTDRAIFMVKDDNWNWINAESHAYKPFICQRDIGDPCEEDMPGGVFISGSCFKYFDSRVSWQSAKVACVDQGGFLAEPKAKELSSSLINYILYMMANLTGKRKDYVWLGGIVHQGGKWRWATSGQAVESITWVTKEPNSTRDVLGPENTMVLSTSGEMVGWHDVSENYLRGYMCQKVLSPMHTQFYMAVLPSPSENTTEEMVVYVTTRFESHLVYLKFVTSCGRTLRTSVSYWKDLQFAVERADRCLGLTDYLHIEASHEVTVFMAVNLSMQLIYPISWTRDLPQGLSYFVNSGFSSSNFNSSMTVASLTNTSNHITLHLTRGTTHVKLDVNQVKMNLRYPSYISVEMTQRSLTVSTDILCTSGGVFLDSAHPVFLYFDYQKEIERTKMTHLAYHQILPVDLLGHKYVSFPDLLADEGRRTTLTLVTVRDDTHIMVYGAKTYSSPQEIYLPFAGDAVIVPLASDDFYFINSSDNFYAMLLFGNSDSQLLHYCMTTLLPTNLWRKQYDFTLGNVASLLDAVVYVVVVVETRLNLTIEIVPWSYYWHCTDIAGSHLSGCYIKLLITDFSPTYYHIRLQNHAAAFAAYLLSTNKDTAACHPLGVSTTPHFTSSFDKKAYLQTLQDPNPCSLASTSTPGVTDSIEGYTQVFLKSSAASSSQNILQTSSEEATITQSDGTREPPSTSIKSSINTKTTATSTTLATNTQPSETAVKLTTTLKSARVYNEAEFNRELAKLHINRKDTLAYKKSKISIADLRVSAAAIGVVCVVIVATIVSVIVAIDVFILCRNPAKCGCCRTVSLKM